MVPLHSWQVFPTLHTIVIIYLHLSLYTGTLIVKEKSVSYATVYPQCLGEYHSVDSCHLQVTNDPFASCRNRCIFSSEVSWRSFHLPFVEWPIRWVEFCVTETGSKYPMGEEGKMDQHYWVYQMLLYLWGWKWWFPGPSHKCACPHRSQVEFDRAVILGFEECDYSCYYWVIFMEHLLCPCSKMMIVFCLGCFSFWTIEDS